jgi:hypothetical protein
MQEEVQEGDLCMVLECEELASISSGMFTTLMGGRVCPSGPLSLFYGSLPSDALCIDNLEPFVRSLPCRAERGVASILLSDVPRLLQGQYLGLTMHIRRHCR